ncbi:Tetratricopeptide repeat-containing protein [Sphingomonas laterariae]|uniref:Tetratricopeptide repeat-containing protein n=1 Tax=Edaphosphingomonas laterariae TaxID=861865 RepID=A0A239BGD0_9SPHN|nr:tetratricopeptide repeat-containing sulfotransferase family protein [Sphingomonas laterariae]SNS06799.1 Tetratricopeptide repeat-containing protein [Sphingomonas laterariae]
MASGAAQSTGTLATALAHGHELLSARPALALEQARAIIEVAPDHGEALALLGRAHAALGQRDAAIAALRLAVVQVPGSADAWRTLGDQLILAGDNDAADAAYARHIRASINDPRLREAAEALCDHRLDVAERILKPHLKQFPTDVAAMRMLAELAGRIGRYADAENLLRRAVELAPGFAAARFNLATVLYRENKAVAALAELDHLLEGEPGNPAYRNLKGAALGRIGDFDDAIAQFEAVLAVRSGEAKIWMSYGHALKTVGRQSDSVHAYRRSIALRPTLGEAWWSLANLKTVKFDLTDIATMETALATSSLEPEDRFHLDFALGKAREDAGDADLAFAHYERGNDLRRTLIDYDAETTTEQVDRATALYTTAYFEARASQGSPSPDPVFILGMPRAGSTLIEQILASHPMIEGTQELPDIIAMARRLSDGKIRATDGCYPEIIGTLDAGALAALGDEYVERTRVHRKTSRPHFIDKMPNNWLHVGLILSILPHARIIDARRHPLDCCFSNYKQHFARGQAFSYSLDDMGRYYRDYVRLMAAIDIAAPGRVHRVHYEAMVDDTEAEVRRLLAYLGLPFDPACLRFHESGRAVRTASSEQVRQPIYRSGMGQWQPFSAHLGPLRAALAGLDESYPKIAI